jgi:Fe-S oxidoreductase
MMIQENAAVLNQYSPKKILTGCPHCYNTLKNEYPQFGARFEVVHATEFILDLFRQGRLTVAPDAAPKRVAFHDSCYLGRWNGIFGAPRELLRIICAGAPVELPRSADKGLCCGAGGGRMFMEEKIGKRINAERVDDILASGAAMTAAACPFCITMLRDGLADRGSKVDIVDIIELADRATG